MGLSFDSKNESINIWEPAQSTHSFSLAVSKHKANEKCLLKLARFFFREFRRCRTWIFCTCQVLLIISQWQAHNLRNLRSVLEKEKLSNFKLEHYHFAALSEEIDSILKNTSISLSNCATVLLCTHGILCCWREEYGRGKHISVKIQKEETQNEK